jgi:dolichol-phosphate mannosyltransferase
MRAVIIVPTYNERENIGPLVLALEAQFGTMSYDMSILVVDDNSPDRTVEAVQALQSQFVNLHLLEGPKAGLGTAYIRGMRHALDRLGAEAVLQMDGDFSHDPEDVPRLMAALEAGADLVIGSRYVPGGSIPVEWGIARRLLSFCGNLMTRHIAGLYPVRDCTSGFRCIRASLLRRIDLDDLHVQGYAFLVTLLFEAWAKGAKIEEIPIAFVERRSGRSKLGFFDMVEFALKIWRLGYRRAARS